MKKSISLITLVNLIIFSFVLAKKTDEIKLPDVIFPLEIIAVKQEEKQPLEPPKVLEINQINVEFNIDLPFVYPVDIKPIVANIQKPQTFLGFPPEKAELADIITKFQDGNFIFAYQQAKEYINKYSKKKKIDKNLLAVANYVLGLSAYEISDLEESLKGFEYGCNTDFYLKTESCISGAVVSILLSDLPRAKVFLQEATLTDENQFLRSIINFLNKEQDTDFQNVKCENLDLGFVNYCKLAKGYYFANQNKLSDALKTLEQVKNYDKYKTILKAIIYLKKKDFSKAETLFDEFLDKYSRADIFSKYAIYGKLIVFAHKGEIQKVLDEIGSLEIRDKNLAQNVYIYVSYQLLKNGKYIDALAVAQKALGLSDKNKETLKKLIAISAYNAGFYEYAYKLLKGIDEPLFNLYTAFALINLGNLYEAEFYLRKAYKYSQRDYIKEKALKYLADIYYFTNKDLKLLETIKLIKKYDPIFASNMLGWYFFKKKEYDKAYQAFKDTYMKAVSAFNMGNEDLAYKIIKDKNDRKSKFLKAYIFLKKLQLSKARKILKELSKGTDKIAQEAGYLYAYSYFSNGEYEKSAKAFEEYYKRFKDTPLGKRAYLRMADSLYNMGKKEEAKTLYTHFIKKHAGTPEAVDAAYLLTIMEMKESSKDVENQIKQFIEKYPDYPHIDLLKFQLANVYFEKGKLDEAVKLLRQLADKNSEVSQQALYRLGYILKSSGKVNEAKKVFLEYLLKYPEGEFTVPVKQLLAEIYEKEGNYELALKLYQQLPQTDQNIYKIALLNFKLGNYFEAKKNFYKLYEKYPKYRNDIAYYLGMIELKKGNLKQAKRYFEEAVKGMDYKKVAQSYLILGDLYEKEGKLEDALNQYVNVIYLYSQEKDLVERARIKGAKILLEQGKRIEASCMLEPISTDNDEASNLKKDLPKCIKD